MATDHQPDDADEVGYRKPPTRSQFQKGQSGNPKGRPKGTPNFATALEKALLAQVVVNEGGQRRTVSKLEATVTQLVNKATLGDPRATQQVLGVLHVLDGEADDSSGPGYRLREDDQQVMARIITRIRHITPNPEGGSHESPESR